MNHFLLMMGGSGTRFGETRPKQYTEINGKPLFSYILKKVDSVKQIDRIVVVTNPMWKEYALEWSKKAITNKNYSVVDGGDNRSRSVLNGLKELLQYANDDDVVMIHDATHPYFDSDVVDEMIEAVHTYGGATLVNKNYDVVYRTNEESLLTNEEPRKLIVSGASPESFKFKQLYDIYNNSSDEELNNMGCAGAIALAYNIPMKAIETKLLNLKITYPEDMELFKLLMDNYYFPEDL